MCGKQLYFRFGSLFSKSEKMFVLFFFAICGAVLLQVFVKSHNISVKAKELTETKNCVTQAAELFETGYTDIEHYQEYFPKLEEDQGIPEETSRYPDRRFQC